MARMTADDLVHPRTAAFDIVVPTIGRSSLAALMAALDCSIGPRPASIVVVDDRPDTPGPLHVETRLRPEPRVVRVAERGPAAARNAGWRRCASPWVIFLDDDVLPDEYWLADLAADVAACSQQTAAIQGQLVVPLRADRLPTDYERNVARLETSTWISADLAVRRRALFDVGGFDERFPRAYREDTDLALRLLDAGWGLERGRRRVAHPVRASSWSTSVRAQRGNVDDALMRRLHGRDWRRRGQAPPGTLGSHVITSCLGVATAVATLAGRRRFAAYAAAATAVAVARFWATRVAHGPRRPAEWLGLACSSMLIPFVAPIWRVYGFIRAVRLAPRGQADRWAARPPALVLFDRDGTLIHDVPYNADPALVTPITGTEHALQRLRQAGVAVGLITNQSGVARGLMTLDDVHAMNAHTERILGPFAVVEVCPHGDSDQCDCRKPAPGMVVDAARRVGVAPHRCAVVGDIGSDVRAAIAAGARGVLVPNLATSAEDIIESPEVVSSVGRAVDLLLGTGAPK